MNIGAAVFIIGYMLILGILGWVVEKRRTTDFSLSEYFIAGGNVGFTQSFLTALATGFSAFTFLGGIGLAYDLGIDGLILGGGAAVACTPAVVLIGKKLWALGKKYQYITPSDFLADRFKSSSVRISTAAIFILFSFFYIQVQIVGTGYIISVLTGHLISYNLAILLVGVITAFYVCLGGMRAVIWTDAIQATLLFFGLLVIAGFAILAYPAATTNAVDTHHELAQSNLSTLYLWTTCIGYGISICVWPQFYVRYFTARNRSSVFSIGLANDLGMIVLLGLLAAIIGFAGVSIFPDIQADKTTIRFIELLPIVLAWPMAAAGTAAAQSTADSILITVSSIAVKDFYVSLSDKKEHSPAKIQWLSRITTIVIAAAAIIVAFNPPELLLKYILDIAYPGFLLVLPPTIAGLFWPRATAKGVLAGMGAGFIALAATTFVWKDALNIYPGIWALVIDTLTLVTVSLITVPQEADRGEEIRGFLSTVDYRELEAQYNQTLDPQQKTSS